MMEFHCNWQPGHDSASASSVIYCHSALSAFWVDEIRQWAGTTFFRLYTITIGILGIYLHPQYLRSMHKPKYLVSQRHGHADVEMPVRDSGTSQGVWRG